MKESVKWWLLTQLLLIFYSFGGICSKLAARESFMSARFLVNYGGLIFIMLVYAVGWQQIIKHLPLIAAYANKATTIVWGVLWGVLFFHEDLSAGKIVGVLLVIAGVMLYAGADHESES